MTRAGVLTIPENKGQGSNIETIRTEIRTEIKDLDPDKYIGTIGLIADRPLGAVKPHYTNFPVNSSEGNWVRAVSEFLTEDDQLLLVGSAWICVASATDTQKAIWEEIREGTPEELYPTSKNIVGQIFRRKAQVSQNIPPNTSTFIEFATHTSLGSFNNNDTEKNTTVLAALGDNIINNVEMNFYARVEFSPDYIGDRQAGISIYAYNPTETNFFNTFISSFRVDYTLQTPGNPVVVWRPGVFNIPKVPPPGSLPVAYAVGLYVRHTSNIDLSITFAELVITGLL
jgi:hypothetical protein